MVNADEIPTSGRFEGGEHRFPVRVYFEDTDAGGIAYHATHLRYMERARTEMLRAVGIGHGAALAAGEGLYVVAELAIRYRKPAWLDDALRVVSRVRRIGGSSIGIHQRVMREADIVSDADVTAVYVTPDGQPRRPPIAWVETFRRLQGDNSAS